MKSNVLRIDVLATEFRFLRRPLRQYALVFAALLAAVTSYCAFSANALQEGGPASEGKIGVSAEDSTPHWPQPIKAPEGAPNIVIILLDDVGFAASSLFGGAVQTPELERLAAQGLRYNNFHVVGVCSSTRAALLAGRNHHNVGYGTVTEFSNGYSGYNTMWPDDAASVAQVLKENGYGTAAFGKWHNTPAWEISPVGPFDRWPTGLGFEYFYGFLRGQDSQWEPELYLNTTPVNAPKTPAQGYHFTTDITDQAIGWLHTQESLIPEKPYFLYFATGATHSPHHVPKEWIEKYRGQFDRGWDQFREEVFARQKKLEVIPANAELTPRPKGLAAWNALSDEQKKLAARQMEVFAGFLAHTDHEVGRLVRTVQDAPRGDNTLIFYIVGDNGASHFGGDDGYEGHILAKSPKDRLRDLERLGGPELMNDYAGPWGWATNTPFQWGKIIASHLGGTRDPLIVTWPKRIRDHGGIRTQFTHVVDVVPTIFEVTGIPVPSSIRGVTQKPLDGTSFAYSFDEPGASSRHRVQYFELFGNRAIYEDGWIAGARHTKVAPAGDRWELYHVAEDYSQARDVATRYPQKLRELQNLFDREAQKNNVYPLLGGAPKRDGAPPHPSLAAGRRQFVYYPDMPRLPVTAVPDLVRSHKIVADLIVPKGGAEGTIVAKGSRYNGFTLYVKEGKLIYDNNYGDGHDVIASSVSVPAGKTVVTYEFTQEGVKSEAVHSSEIRGGGKLYIDGRLVGQGAITHIRDFGAAMWMYSGGFGVGRSYISPVSAAYEPPFAFTGTIEKVTVELP